MERGEPEDPAKHESKSHSIAHDETEEIFVYFSIDDREKKKSNASWPISGFVRNLSTDIL